MEKISLFLVHGFMSVKSDMNFLEIKFTEKNFTVYNASMIGHDYYGEDIQIQVRTSFDEEIFMQTKWEDWFSSIEKQFLEKAKEGKLILIGHSMGGLLVLRLAQKYPQHVHALVCLAAPLFMNRYYPFEINNTLVPLAYIFHFFVKKIKTNLFHFKKKKVEKNKDILKNSLDTSSNSQAPLQKKHYYYPPQLVSLFKNMKLVRKDMEKVIAPLLCIQVFNDKRIPNASSYEICRNTSSKYKILKMYTILDPQSSRHDIMCHEETREQVYSDIFHFILSLN